MVVNCAVANCISRARKGSGITFHRFPADKELLAKWIRATGRANYEPSDFAKVCSMHFHKEDMYTDKYNRRFLKKGVVPSRFYIVRKIKRRMKLVFATIPEPSNEVVITSEDTEQLGQLPDSPPEESQTDRNPYFKRAIKAKKRKPVKSFRGAFASSQDTEVTDSTRKIITKPNEYQYGSILMEDQLHNSQFVESEIVITSDDTEIISTSNRAINDIRATDTSLERQAHVQFDKSEKRALMLLDTNQEDRNSNFKMMNNTNIRKPVLSKQENGLVNHRKPNDSSSLANLGVDHKTNKMKKQTLDKRNGKREIGLEDFEKINDTRLADPKVVKQLLTVAYKTIEDQRKIIANWQLNHKNMERRIVQLHKTIVRLKSNGW